VNGAGGALLVVLVGRGRAAGGERTCEEVGHNGRDNHHERLDNCEGRKQYQDKAEEGHGPGP